MSDGLVSHEAIEQAFRGTNEVIESLPDRTETREVKRLLTVAEELAHDARERTKLDQNTGGSMLRLLTLTIGLLAFTLAPLPAYADDGGSYALPRPTADHAYSHSMAGGAECGDKSFDGVANMTKGRTDGMVVSASYSVGCKSYSYRNLVGTGLDEAYGYSGQEANCVRVGQTDVARFYEFYFDTKINPADVKVSCSAYSGAD